MKKNRAKYLSNLQITGLKKVVTCILIFLFFLCFGFYDSSHAEQSTITVYGTFRCPYTSGFREQLALASLQYIFKDIENHEGAEAEMWNLVRNAGIGDGSNVNLPIVDIDGKIFERPSFESIKSLIKESVVYATDENTGSVKGVVKDYANKLYKAQIKLVSVSNPVKCLYYAFANYEGKFNIKGIPIDNYKIVIENNTAIVSSLYYIAQYVLNGSVVNIQNNVEIDTGTTILTISNLPAIQTAYDINAIYPIDKNLIYLAGTQNFYIYSNGNKFTYPVIPNAGYINGIDYSHLTKRVITLDQVNKKLYVIDADNSSKQFNSVVSTIEGLPDQPIKLEYTSNGTNAYIACNGAMEVVLVDIPSSKIIAHISLNGYTQDVAIDETNNKIYAGIFNGTLSPPNQLAVIDINKESSSYHQVLEYIPIGDNGCYNQIFDGNNVYSSSDKTIDRINPVTKEVSSVVLNGTYSEIAYSHISRCLYFYGYDDENLKNYQVNVYSIPQNKIIQQVLIGGPTEYFYGVGLSYDDAILALCSMWSGRLLLYSVLSDGTISEITPSTPDDRPCSIIIVLGKDNPQLESLRDFRDNTLAQSTIGRKVIQIYYNNTDSINSALERSPALRAVARRVLEVIAPMVGKN